MDYTLFDKPWASCLKNTLVIPDVHQNVRWAKAILEKEAGNYDNVVFLGDFFDSFLEPPAVSSVEDTAQFVVDLIDKKYGEVNLILGNHDLAYLEAWRSSSNFKNPKNLYNLCSGYTNNKSKNINTVLDWNKHWKKFNLFYFVNGWLLSHAGISESFYSSYYSLEENLDKLYNQFDEAINLVTLQPNDIFDVGHEYGGKIFSGGPLWCRPWAFSDNLPVPQIFGHTFSGLCGIKSIGRCLNIDGAQTSYLIIRKDGSVCPKALDKISLDSKECVLEKF